MKAVAFIALLMLMAAIAMGGALMVALLLEALHNDEEDENP